MPLQYLLDCSNTSLKTFRLKQYEKRASLLKVAIEAYKEAVEAGALALFAEWIDRFGPEIAATGAIPIEAKQMVEREVSEKEPKRGEHDRALTKPGPQYWRAELRRFQRTG